MAGNYNTDPERVRTTDDRAATPFNASVTLPVLLNDRSYTPGGRLLPAVSRFDVNTLGPDDYLARDARKIRYPGRGTWTVNADGSVTYVPRRGYVGTDAVNIMVFDDHEDSGSEELVVTVQPGAVAKADAATTAMDVPASVAVLADDTPGRNADGTAGSMDTTYVRFPVEGQPAGATTSAYWRTLTVPGEGVYTADRVTGKITFDPESGFIGKTHPITYSARDTVTRTDGRVVHTSTTAILTVTVS